jgi:type 1 glutamine amidotransferase
MSFTVYPMSRAHPIIEGIDAFAIEDELYIQRYEPGVRVHAVAVHENVAHPMVWTRREGAGKVAHVALGHSQKVWEALPYRRLMLQAMAWLAGATAG